MAWKQRARQRAKQWAKQWAKQLWLGGFLVVCTLLPGWGYAQAGGRGCALVDGSSNVTFNIPPAVSFRLDQAPVSGLPLYISTPYLFQYRCINNVPGQKRAALVMTGDFGPLRKALQDASLSLYIVYDRLQEGSWNPDPLNHGYVPYFSVDAPYQGDTGVRTGRIMLMLFASRQVTTPLRVFLPATSGAFKLVADEQAVADPGVRFITTPSRFQYIPSCIGSVSVDNTVQFDTVLTTPNGKVPQAKPFNVTSRINTAACAGLDSLIAPPVGTEPLDQLYLRTLVSFLPQGGERTDLADEAIYLKNADGQENGLKLSITNAANETIKFGTVPLDSHGGPASSRYNGNLGVVLQGTVLSRTQTYTAHLERTGAELKTGQYRTQVLVKVTWF